MKPIRPAPPSATPTHPHDLAHPTTPAAPARAPIAPLHTLATPHPSVAAAASLHAPLAPVLGASLPLQQAAAAGAPSAAPAQSWQAWERDTAGTWHARQTFPDQAGAQNFLNTLGNPPTVRVLPVGQRP